MSAMLTMIWPMARNGFKESTSVWNGADDSTGLPPSRARGGPSAGRLEQRRPGHPPPARQSGQLADRRRDVGEDAVAQPSALHRSARQQERDGVQRMGGHRV